MIYVAMALLHRSRHIKRSQVVRQLCCSHPVASQQITIQENIRDKALVSRLIIAFSSL